MKPLPINAGVSCISFYSKKWFIGKYDLITRAGNKPEYYQRLVWLSEGSLSYHIEGKDCPHGGNQKEIALYNEFREYLSTL